MRGRAPAASAPIVPKGSIAGRSLAAVVAIMTFLAALTTGAVMLVVSAASDWQSDVEPRGHHPGAARGRARSRGGCAQGGRDRAAQRAASRDVQAYSKEESARLVEPWLGAGLALDDLPIPRLIVVKLVPGARPDLAALRKALAAQVAPASLDDHRHWIDRMRTMAGTAIVAGLAVLALVLVVTVLSVTFATRGAMATNRPIVEVLHYVGATDSFISSQFQHHFLILGFKGGADRRRGGNPAVRHHGGGKRLACRNAGRR